MWTRNTLCYLIKMKTTKEVPLQIPVDGNMWSGSVKTSSDVVYILFDVEIFMT